jgi:MFS family permease
MTQSHESTAPDGASDAAPPTALWLLFIVTALMSIGYGIVFTLLADIRDRFGFSDGDVGLIAFAGFASGFASQMFLSRFADRGHTALMVRIGMAIAASSMLWMVFANDLWQWVGGRLLFGLGTGMVAPAIRRVVIARDPTRVGANLGRQTAFDVGGFVLGPLIAAVLAQLINLRAPFLFLFVTYVGVFVLIGRIDLRSGAQDTAHRALRTLITQPAMQSALAAAIAFYLTIGMFEAIWAILLRDLDAPTWLIGVTVSAFTLPMIFFASRGGALAQSRGPIRILTISITVVGVAVCLLTIRHVVMKRPLSQLVGSLIGIALAIYLTLRPGGQAGDFYLKDFWTNGIYGSVLLLSVIIRFPIIGVMVGLFTNQGLTWRKDQDNPFGIHHNG